MNTLNTDRLCLSHNFPIFKGKVGFAFWKNQTTIIIKSACLEALIYSSLTKTVLPSFLFIFLMVVLDADAAVNLVEQSWTQVGKLAGGDQRIGIQAIIVE